MFLKSNQASKQIDIVAAKDVDEHIVWENSGANEKERETNREKTITATKLYSWR